MVAVDGKISTRSYEKDGYRRYITEVVAENVTFLDTKKQTASETQNIQTTTEQESDPFADMGEIVQHDNLDVDLPF